MNSKESKMAETVLSSTVKSVSRKALQVWLCTAFFYLYQFVIRVSPQAFANDMMSTLNLDACALGSIISLYYIGYASMQIPAGLILDRLGVRYPLTLCCLLCATGAFIFGTSENIMLLSIGRLMMGIGSAFGFISNVKVGSLWFPPRYLSLVVGLTLMLGTVGALTANTPLAMLVEATGWAKAMLYISFAGTITSMLCWLFVEDRTLPTTEGLQPTPQNNSLAHIQETLVAILKNPLSWLLGVYGFLMYLPLAGFGDLWATSYMQSHYGLDRVSANTYVSWFYIGVGLGSPAWPWVLTRFQNYRLSMTLSALLTAVFFGIVLYVPGLPLLTIATLLFLTGAAAGGQFIAFAAVTEINTRERTATASGMHNMLCMLSGVIAQPLIGFVMDRSGLTQQCVLSDATTYPPLAYTYGLTVVFVGLALAILIAFSIKTVPYVHGEEASS
jgi:sugar phosphate permease